MAYDHFDVENFEASMTKYLVDVLSASPASGYDMIFDESTIDFDTVSGNWYYVEFLGHDGEITTKPPVYHIMVHIRTRSETAEVDMTVMTRSLVNTLKDKWIDLYDLDSDVIIGKLRSLIRRESPKESVARQSSRGFNRSLLIRVTYGQVGVVYT